jgi:hypothetical protein
MDPRDISAELVRLKQLARGLIAAIETLQARIDAGANEQEGAALPPAARPTTRMRRVTATTRTNSADGPSSAPASAHGTYRYVPPSSSKKR